MEYFIPPQFLPAKGGQVLVFRVVNRLPAWPTEGVRARLNRQLKPGLQCVAARHMGLKRARTGERRKGIGHLPENSVEQGTKFQGLDSDSRARISQYKNSMYQ